MINKDSRILILAPHTDDAEFGCGGSIAKFTENGNDVFCVAFSAAEISIPSRFDKNINKINMREAMEILGIKKNFEINSFQARKFPEFRQEILDYILKIRTDIKPDIVFLPSTFDTHQDHQVIRNEGFRAFKKTTLVGYEIPWNNLTFTTNLFIRLTEKHVKLKISSIKKYISQLGRDYVDKNFIESVLRTRGGQAGCIYAEAFEIIRWLI
ncbi:MAG: PIG-L family deacetylase [Bacteroidales bacterium]|nr:PIG-L family deacetylase [Bacteroidales bacterium]